MDTSNSQTTTPKTLPNQSVFCPWTSRAPITSSNAIRYGIQKPEEQANIEILSQNHLTCQHKLLNQSCLNNHQMTDGCANSMKPSASIQQSSSQFFHFLHLMQLFPDVHPATLHTVLVLCKSDFFRAVDKLLYAKRCKQIYNKRRSVLQACATSKCNRHKPYCYAQATVSAEGTCQNPNVNIQSHFVIHGYNQTSPLDASVKKIQIGQNHPSTSEGKVLEGILKRKSNESRKILHRNKVKAILLPSTSSSTDLPPVASPQCTLPIRPLSPINGMAEDLSRQSVSIEQNNEA
ncbi:hypothetical protein ILUMI_21637 [Ignelater luminosus]|uniref:Uncharacterized protein n=1 Tax=Ignelater luminosus TaxID=2038154 RepID=A0A8K0CC32_IGNLU|nr:hypothetical protein ILUMI_21637 [Ignelater luminosus]